MPRTREAESSKSSPQKRIDQFFTTKRVENLFNPPENQPAENQVQENQVQPQQQQQQQQPERLPEAQQGPSQAPQQTLEEEQKQQESNETQMEEDFEEDQEDDDWDDEYNLDGEGGEIVDDNELMNLLENTKETRERLKTGGLEELVADFEEFEDNLITAVGIGKARRSKRKITQGEARLPAAVKEQLGRANALYIEKDYGQAVDLLQDLITKYPNVHQAWNTLGLVQEEMGNTERSLQLRMVAAHINQGDIALWKELGVKSLETNANKQALYCFSKVLAVDPLDIDVLWDRSFLLKQMGRPDEAIDGFQQILSVIPHHLKVVNELVRIYRSQGRTKEAIEMYEEAIQHHLENDTEEDEDRMREDEPEDFKDKLGYAEVNMLSELYLMQNEYRRALDWIKTGIRYVQGRRDEEWWQDSEIDNDGEYFERDEDDAEGSLRADIPIELRIRMGICRVYLGDVRIASKHFGYLFKYPATTYPDLHQDIAYAYLDKRHYDLALEVFQKIIDVSDEVELDLLIRTADCYFHVGELDTAAMFYVNVLEEQPNNLEVMMSLAAVYEEQGREEEALELVDFVMKMDKANREKKKEEERLRRLADNEELAEGELSRTRKGKEKASIFDEAARERRTLVEKRKRQKEQFLLEEQEKELRAQTLYEKIKDLDEVTKGPVTQLDRSLMREYIRVAGEMWHDFSETTAFFPSDHSKYTGFYAFRRYKPRTRSALRDAMQMAQRLRRKTGTEQQMDEDEDLDEEERSAREEEQRDIELSSSNHFRQIEFDEWLRIIVKYATMLANSKPVEKAYDVLKRAEEANVFYHERNRRTTIKIALLGCAVMNRNEVIMEETVRWLMRFYPFDSDPYRIYSAITTLAQNIVTSFADYNCMKQIMRTIRAMDAAVSKQSGQGENEQIRQLNSAINASEAVPFPADESLMVQLYHAPGPQEGHSINRLMKQGVSMPTRVNPVLFVIFGQQMSLARNFMSASMFFLRAYALHQDDPLIMLQTGIAMLLRAMSRKSINRHYQVLQGMMFIQKYYRSRNKNQEAEFNLARAFHQLGLTHLAVDHYERVLIMPSAAFEGKMEPGNLEDVYDISKPALMDENDDTDLKREAAYNLHIIYATSGSFELSQVLLHKYCTI